MARVVVPPLKELTGLRLGNSSKLSSKIQAWTNPTYDTSVGPGDTAITVKPSNNVDFVDEMFPGPESLFRRMSWQFWIVIVLIAGHALLTAYTDPLNTRRPLVQVIVYSGQVGLLLAIIMGFYVLTSQTLYIQLGRYDLYLREFAFIYMFFVVELALYLAVKVYATVLLLRRAAYLDVWDQPAYAPLWYIQRVVLVFFWVAAAYSAISVFDVRYFDPVLLLGLQQKANDQERGVKNR